MDEKQKLEKEQLIKDKKEALNIKHDEKDKNKMIIQG